MALTKPKFLSKAFAESGAKSDIPIDSQIGIKDGAASYETGFPPLTMTPVVAGGVPPSGRDFNGALYDITNATRYTQAGMNYPFDQDFCDVIGGYPKGSVLLSTDGITLWQSTVDANTTDPDSGSASSWVKFVARDEFDSSNLENGWQKLPSGLILQWGLLNLDQVGNFNQESVGGVNYYTRSYRQNYVKEFSVRALSLYATLAAPSHSSQGGMFGNFVSVNRDLVPFPSENKSKFTISVTSRFTTYAPTIHWLAIGI